MLLKVLAQLISIYLVTLLIACQTYEQDGNANSTDEPLLNGKKNDTGLSNENGVLDLSLDTLEQQIKDKTKAAEELAAAREKRVIVETERSNHLNQPVNVATFARKTFNKKGERIYSRSPFHVFDHQSECAIFNTEDNAQRFFLGSGGPKIDIKNLDPDGDGFACNWDPTIYRQLAIPND